MISATKLGRTACAVVLVACALWVWYWTRPASGLAFLDAREGSHWIVYPLAFEAGGRPALALTAEFERDFDLAAAPARAELRARALGRGRVDLNGREVARLSGRNPVVVDVRGALVAGANRLRVQVQNATGPPGLELTLRWPGGELVSDADFTASIAGGVALPARPAAQREAPAEPLPPEPGIGPWAALIAAALALAAMIAVLPPARVERWALVAVGLFWAALFVHDLGAYPALMGFDAPDHAAYARMILAHHALPSAGEGLVTYHPPLFHLIWAACAGLLGRDPADAAVLRVLRGFTLLLGGFQVGGIYAIICRFWPQPGAPARLAALLFAAALPLHLSLFQYAGNEGLAAALGTLSLWATLRALQAGELSWSAACGIGALLGLGLLAKLSLLVVAFVALPALLLAHPRRYPRTLACAGIALALATPHYARTALVYGSPFVGNWTPGLVPGLPPAGWWQDPGYRQPLDFLRFGRALFDPWFAGTHGVLDGLYSTLFGDGLASGATARRLGPSWNADWLRAAAVLGVIPSLLVGLGIALGVRRLWRRPAPAALLLPFTAVAMAAATFYMLLRVPSYGQAKMSYAHPALPALALALALASDWLSGASRGSAATPRIRRALVFAPLLVWALCSGGSFWIRYAAPETRAQNAEKALALRDPARAEAELTAVSRDDAARPQVQAAACELAVARLPRAPDTAREARTRCAAALETAPDDSAVAYALALAQAHAGAPDDAIATLRSALRADPDSPRLWSTLAWLLAARDRHEAARDALRHARALDPFRIASAGSSDAAPQMR